MYNTYKNIEYKNAIIWGIKEVLNPTGNGGQWDHTNTKKQKINPQLMKYKYEIQRYRIQNIEYKKKI